MGHRDTYQHEAFLISSLQQAAFIKATPVTGAIDSVAGVSIRESFLMSDSSM
mgnify:CR=1 FL=1